jgi:hypothetical protein
MPTEGVENRPNYPQPPPGIARLNHLPTVEASIRYWEAVRIRAIRSRNRALERTALGLRLSYEAARHGLLQARPTPPRSRPGPGDVRPG